ncbi:MAG: glycosyltransferase family 61 protein [Bryobacteraceae bacterium]
MRKFKEADILSSAAGPSQSYQVLLHDPLKGKQKLRSAPQYIDNPFSQNFHDGFTKPHPINLADQFCVEIPDAVLFGERAAITRDDILTTDYRSSPPAQLMFPLGVRKFEMMEPTVETDEFLTSDRVDHPQVEINETACLLSSTEHWNYGAVLLRQIPKLLILRKLGLSELPVLSPGSRWHKEMLQIFGVKRIVEHNRDKSYYLTKLIVPSQKTHSFYCDQDVVQMFDEVACKISASVPTAEAPWLYVSRITHGKKHPNYRKCLNEEELANSLLRFGFKVIEPEKYQVKEQIAIFRSARFVVGPSGAGMFNTLFCRPGTEVLSLEPLPNWIWLHCNMFGSMGHNYGFVTGGAMADDPEPVQKSWMADIPAVIRRVEQVMRKLDV